MSHSLRIRDYFIGPKNGLYALPTVRHSNNQNILIFPSSSKSSRGNIELLLESGVFDGFDAGINEPYFSSVVKSSILLGVVILAKFRIINR